MECEFCSHYYFFKFLMYSHPFHLAPRLHSMIACENFTFIMVHQPVSILEYVVIGTLGRVASLTSFMFIWLLHCVQYCRVKGHFLQLVLMMGKQDYGLRMVFSITYEVLVLFIYSFLFLFLGYAPAKQFATK